MTEVIFIINIIIIWFTPETINFINLRYSCMCLILFLSLPGSRRSIANYYLRRVSPPKVFNLSVLNNSADTAPFPLVPDTVRSH